MNKPLSQAYYLKEDPREIYNQPTINEAEERLNSWVSMALDTDSKPLMSLANTINAAKRKYSLGIMDGYQRPKWRA